MLAALQFDALDVDKDGKLDATDLVAHLANIDGVSFEEAAAAALLVMEGFDTRDEQGLALKTRKASKKVKPNNVESPADVGPVASLDFGEFLLARNSDVIPFDKFLGYAIDAKRKAYVEPHVLESLRPKFDEARKRRGPQRAGAASWRSVQKSIPDLLVASRAFDSHGQRQSREASFMKRLSRKGTETRTNFDEATMRSCSEAAYAPAEAPVTDAPATDDDDPKPDFLVDPLNPGLPATDAPAPAALEKAAAPTGQAPASDKAEAVGGVPAADATAAPSVDPLERSPTGRNRSHRLPALAVQPPAGDGHDAQVELKSPAPAPTDLRTPPNRSGAAGPAVSRSPSANPELPPGWKVAIDKKYGREYFFHPETGRSSWVFPTTVGKYWTSPQNFGPS